MSYILLMHRDINNNNMFFMSLLCIMLRCKMQNLFNQPICKRNVFLVSNQPRNKRMIHSILNQKQVPSTIGKYLTYVHGLINL